MSIAVVCHNSSLHKNHNIPTNHNIHQNWTTLCSLPKMSPNVWFSYNVSWKTWRWWGNRKADTSRLISSFLQCRLVHTRGPNKNIPLPDILHIDLEILTLLIIFQFVWSYFLFPPVSTGTRGLKKSKNIRLRARHSIHWPWHSNSKNHIQTGIA